MGIPDKLRKEVKHMPLLDQIRTANLTRLANARFNTTLTEAELRVVRESAASVDPPEPATGASRPDVRSEFIRWLATDPEAVSNIDPKGLRVWGVSLPDKLDFEECHILPTLYFRQCTLKSEINLMAAETKGIYLTECDVAGTVRGDGVTVHGPIDFSRTAFSSEVCLIGASIANELSCVGAKFSCLEDALSLDDASIGSNIIFNDGFESRGMIRLLGARVAGSIECQNAKFTTNKIALSLDGARIEGDVFFRKGTECSGDIRMPLTEIGGDLEFCDVDMAVVYCRYLKLSGAFIWLLIRRPLNAKLKLIGASVRSLRDDSDSRPARGNLQLDGFEYGDLMSYKNMDAEDVANNRFPDKHELDADDRVEWLMLQDLENRAKPQPWMQLKELLEKKGEDSGAKHVLYKFRCLQARKSCLLLRWWKVAFAWLDEAPQRIVYSIAVTLIFGTLVFTAAGLSGALAPTEKDAYSAFIAGSPMPAAYPVLNPFIYTLENSLPLVKLGQDDKWAPDRRHATTHWFNSYWFLMWTRWALILFGWFQATVLAAALSNRLKL
jgi:hypothetical protein